MMYGISKKEKKKKKMSCGKDWCGKSWHLFALGLQFQLFPLTGENKQISTVTEEMHLTTLPYFFCM